MDGLYALSRELGNTLDLDEASSVIHRHSRVLAPYRALPLHLAGGAVMPEEGLWDSPGAGQLMRQTAIGRDTVVLLNLAVIV